MRLKLHQDMMLQNKLVSHMLLSALRKCALLARRLRYAMKHNLRN